MMKLNNITLKRNLILLFLILLLISYFLHVVPYVKSIDRAVSSINETDKRVFKSKCECRKEVIELTRRSDAAYQVIVKNIGESRMERAYVGRLPLENITCDLYNVLRRGPNQNVIGFSLYGKNEFYYKELKHVLKLVATYYPGWIARIHYDRTVDESVVCEIECHADNVDFCAIETIPHANHVHAMKWRWFPIGDPFVDQFMSRDTDAWITQRESDAVNEWLKADTLFHVMRDHPYHSVPILGGMWAYKNYLDRHLANSLFTLITNSDMARQYNADGKHHKQGDQEFLAQRVWPIAKHNATVHASFFCDHAFDAVSRTRPFPTQRPIHFCYVSCIYCCEEIYKPKKKFEWKCPKNCRPEEHQDDWEYC